MLTRRACLAAIAALIPLALPAAAPESLAALEAQAARFAPVDLRVDLSALPANERQSLTKLVEAATLIDALYLHQLSASNVATLLRLQGDDSTLGRARLKNFLIEKGPWSSLDGARPFLPGAGERPPQRNFYPADATRAEVETWINGLDAAGKQLASGFFSTIRRNNAGQLIAVPYSLAYQGELQQIARLLREAADLTRQPTLSAYLRKRADALLSNDYYDSDIAWMELDASIEPTIGPYEVYEDEWFNFKAAFEAFITVTDAEETRKLARFGAELQGLEDRLPIEPRHRRKALGGLSPIRVVNVVFSAGDANHGVQTAAFNLPNDERVVDLKGSKRTMLKNVQQAKFDQVLQPIAQLAMRPEDRPFVAFDPFFTHILMHELMHGLGPQAITVAGRTTTVRQELKELNGTLEEAKADISGLWALQQLMDKGVIDRSQERAMYVTFVASSLRTLRFGVESAHARGMALQLNHLLDAGALKFDANGFFALDLPKTKRAVISLTRQIMTLQANGDYAGTKRLLDAMTTVREPVQQLITKLQHLPVDIAPRFVTAEELLRP